MMNHMCIRGLFVLIAALGIFVADGAPPRRIETDNVASLLLRSGRVVLAEVRSLNVREGFRNYDVEVIETLKGVVSGNVVIRLPLHPAMPAADEISFFNSEYPIGERRQHNSIYFWLGRSQPYIEDIGGAIDRRIRRGRHVIFLDHPNHAKGVEPIFEPNDPWYRTVKDMAANGEQRGHPLRAVEFLKMFAAVHLAKCGEATSQKFRLGKLWGHDLRIPTDPMPDFPGSGPCERRKGQSFVYLSLFLDAQDQASVSVPISNGLIQFADRYGDIVIVDREVALTTAVATLAGSKPPPSILDD